MIPPRMKRNATLFPNASEPLPPVPIQRLFAKAAIAIALILFFASPPQIVALHHHHHHHRSHRSAEQPQIEKPNEKSRRRPAVSADLAEAAVEAEFGLTELGPLFADSNRILRRRRQSAFPSAIPSIPASGGVALPSNWSLIGRKAAAPRATPFPADAPIPFAIVEEEEATRDMESLKEYVFQSPVESRRQPGEASPQRQLIESQRQSASPSPKDRSPADPSLSPKDPSPRQPASPRHVATQLLQQPESPQFGVAAPALPPTHLPPCSNVPRLLCCTTRVLAKCFDGCADYVGQKCPHKLRQIESVAVAKGSVDREISQNSQSAHPHDADLLHTEFTRRSPSRPSTVIPIESIAAGGFVAPLDPKSDPLGAPLDPQDAESILPKSGSSPQWAPSRPIVLRTTTTTAETPKTTADDENPSGYSQKPSNPPASTQKPTESAIALNLTNLIPSKQSDADPDGFSAILGQPQCGTAESRPAYAPCVARTVADRRFAACCRQNVPPECHALCTYEHRDEAAAQNLVVAIQQNGCDLKWLSLLLTCANHRQDNRPCCRHLGMATPTFGVGDRMCDVGSAGRDSETLGTVEQNDLVCLSNWNVIMYCARSGIGHS